MATTAMDYENSGGDRFDGMLDPLDTRFTQRVSFPHRDSEIPPSETNLGPLLDEAPRYDRDNRSASPRSDNGGNDSTRRRSASPGGDRSVLRLSCHPVSCIFATVNLS